ncbi:mRNA interferase YafQ [Bacteroidales bacterium Barb6]|nr:mRNA interferase YafQ [Bacteroidales bacterium Barb6]
MYTLRMQGKFKRDLKLCAKRGYDMNLMWYAAEMLCETGILPPMYLTHRLKGKFRGYYECHITPDWLLIWYISGNEIVFVSTGTHSDLLDR